MVDYAKGKVVENKMQGPTKEQWMEIQQGLNSVGLATPKLVVDGIPGPLTLQAAQGLVPLIMKTIEDNKKKD